MKYPNPRILRPTTRAYLQWGGFVFCEIAFIAMAMHFGKQEITFIAFTFPLLAFGQFSQSRREFLLFRDGSITVGKISKVESDGDGDGGATTYYEFVHPKAGLVKGKVDYSRRAYKEEKFLVFFREHHPKEHTIYPGVFFYLKDFEDSLEMERNANRMIAP